MRLRTSATDGASSAFVIETIESRGWLCRLQGSLDRPGRQDGILQEPSLVRASGTFEKQNPFSENLERKVTN